MKLSRLSYEDISIQADILSRSGRSAEASKLLRRGLRKARKAGDDGYALFFKAQRAHHIEKNYKSALKFYRQALRMTARNILFLKNVEIALKLLRRTEEDMEYLRAESMAKSGALENPRRMSAYLRLYGRAYDAVECRKRSMNAQLELA